MSRRRVLGLLLAAGKGTRMGRLKQLVPIPDPRGQMLPMVACAFDAISGACDAMFVVVGSRRAQVEQALHPRDFVRVFGQPDGQMSESIIAGLRAALHLDAEASVLLQPADHPRVAPTTLSRLIDNSAQFPQRAIIPQFATRRGHPILIPPTIVAKLTKEPPRHGLNRYLRDDPGLCHLVNVDDADVTADIDNPDDLKRWLREKRDSDVRPC